MRLLLDEDTQARTLVRLLTEAGHDVSTVEGSGLRSMADDEILRHAVREGRVLMTRNCGDFAALHAADPTHAGIISIYQDADPSKSMSYVEIVRALGNLVAAELPLEREWVVLNAWRW